MPTPIKLYNLLAVCSSIPCRIYKADNQRKEVDPEHVGRYYNWDVVSISPSKKELLVRIKPKADDSDTISENHIDGNTEYMPENLINLAKTSEQSAVEVIDSLVEIVEEEKDDTA